MKVLDYDGLEYYNGQIEDKYATKNSPALSGTPTAPTPTSSDDSTKIATTAFVHDNTDDKLPLSGGTLTGSLTITTTSAPIALNTTGTDFRDIQTFSTDGNHRIGMIRMSKDANNNCVVSIGANNTSNAAASGITITRGASGDPSVTTVTPATTDNSTKIATTAYVKANVPASVGNANIPVYTDSNGKIVSTGKSFANYATLASPALTGNPTAPTPATSDNSTKIATTAYVKAQGYTTATGHNHDSVYTKPSSFVVEEKASASFTLAGTSSKSDITFNAAKSGYTPLGVVGFWISGTGATYANIMHIDTSGNTVTMAVRNLGNGSVTWTGHVEVLYVKN